MKDNNERKKLHLTTLHQKKYKDQAYSNLDNLKPSQMSPGLRKHSVMSVIHIK